MGDAMKVANLLAGAVACITMFGAGAASAATLPLDGGWQYISFDGAGSDVTPTFQFSLTSTARFDITDAYFDGDQFEVTINGISQGLTSTPTNDGTFADVDEAFSSPLFSHGSYLLGPGDYTVSATAFLSPYGSGGGAARLVSAGAVPEPASWALMLGGFGLVGGAMRSRRKATVSFG